MHVGGPAETLVEADTTDDVVAAVLEAQAGGDRVLLLAGGSNLLVADEGFAGTVVRIGSRGIHTDRGPDGQVTVTAAAGEVWDSFVRHCVDEGWAGVECLAGIPGAVGATPIQNVGAYGQDVSATISEVTVLDRATGEVGRMSAQECGFGYRTSRFKYHDDFVVLGVTFELREQEQSMPVAYAELARSLDVEPGQTAPLADVSQAVVALRRGKGMVLDADDHDTWSCGSFFTNPVLSEADFSAFRDLARTRLGAEVSVPGFPDPVTGGVKTSAAWLIQRSGFDRGYGSGPAQLSTKHSLALTNRGRATTADVLALAREVRDGVREQWGITLHPEPVLVGVSLD